MKTEINNRNTGRETSHIRLCNSSLTTRNSRLLPSCSLHKAGSHWDITFDSAPPFHLPDSLGIRYLDHLLHHPNKPIPAFDLELAITPEKATARTTLAVSRQLDTDAIKASLRQINELRNLREQAASEGNLAATDHLDADIAALETQFQHPHHATDARERARCNVGKAIAAVRRRLLHGDRNEKAFAEHITQHIHTGYECLYLQPEGPIWK